MKTWGSILTFPWRATLLLMGHLSHAESVSPASSLRLTKLLLLLVHATMHHVRDGESPKQGPPLPRSQVLLIGALATNGVSLPLAVMLICLAQPGREVGPTAGAGCCPACLGNGPCCSLLAVTVTPPSSQNSFNMNVWGPGCSV